MLNIQLPWQTLLFQTPDRSWKATDSAFLQKICRATKLLPHQPRETHRRHRRSVKESGERGEEHDAIQTNPPQETLTSWTPSPLAGTKAWAAPNPS